MKPLYTKGDRTDIYPILDLSINYIHIKDFGKSYIYKTIPTHQPKYILATKLNGFRNNSWTVIASYKLINEILLALNKFEYFVT